MLVLTRKPQQTITIGNDIKISVVKVRGNAIQLGIEAPKDVRIMRSELLDREPQPENTDLKLIDDESNESEPEENTPHQGSNNLPIASAGLVIAV